MKLILLLFIFYNLLFNITNISAECNSVDISSYTCNDTSYLVYNASCCTNYYCNYTSPNISQICFCPPGYITYDNVSLDSTSCNLCYDGYFCYQSIQYACPKGYYCNSTISIAPIKCPINHTTLSTSSKSKDDCVYIYEANINCNPGFIYNGTHCDPCNSGYYCYNQAYICPINYYCPPGSIIPLQCPNNNITLNYGSKSIYDCITPIICDPGMINYYNTSVNAIMCKLCPVGKYCYNSIEYNCPFNHYCIEGSAIPIKCDGNNFTIYQNSVSRDNCTYYDSGDSSVYTATLIFIFCTTFGIIIVAIILFFVINAYQEGKICNGKKSSNSDNGMQSSNLFDGQQLSNSDTGNQLSNSSNGNQSNNNIFQNIMSTSTNIKNTQNSESVQTQNIFSKINIRI